MENDLSKLRFSACIMEYVKYSFVLAWLLPVMASQAQSEDWAQRATEFKECAAARAKGHHTTQPVNLPRKIAEDLIQEEIEAGIAISDGWKKIDPSIFYEAETIKLNDTKSHYIIIRSAELDRRQAPVDDRINDYVRSPHSSNIVWIYEQKKGNFRELLSEVVDNPEESPYIMHIMHNGYNDVCVSRQNILHILTYDKFSDYYLDY